MAPATSDHLSVPTTCLWTEQIPIQKYLYWMITSLIEILMQQTFCDKHFMSQYMKFHRNWDWMLVAFGHCWSSSVVVMSDLTGTASWKIGVPHKKQPTFCGENTRLRRNNLGKNTTGQRWSLDLLMFRLDTPYFMYKSYFCKQNTAMVCPVSPVVANLYMEQLEQKALYML